MTQVSPENIANHPVLTEVYATCTEIEQLEAELKQIRTQMEAQIKQKKEQLDKAIQELPAKIGDNADLRDEVVHHLYWFNDTVSATTVKQVFRMVTSKGALPKDLSRVLREAHIDVQCDDCHAPFQLKLSSRSDRKYTKWHHTCDACRAKQDEATRKHFEQSQERLKSRMHELSTMPYYEYLQTPEWAVRRTKAMRKAGFRCQVCNAYGVQLNVHHRTYARRGNEWDSDLITLCHTCHEIFHTNGQLATEGGK